MRQFDSDGNGYLNYDEFATALSDCKCSNADIIEDAELGAGT